MNFQSGRGVYPGVQISLAATQQPLAPRARVCWCLNARYWGRAGDVGLMREIITITVRQLSLLWKAYVLLLAPCCFFKNIDSYETEAIIIFSDG